MPLILESLPASMAPKQPPPLIDKRSGFEQKVVQGAAPLMRESEQLQAHGNQLVQTLSNQGDMTYEWHLERDTIQWGGPIHILFGDDPHLSQSIGGDMMSMRLSPEAFVRRMNAVSKALATGKTQGIDYAFYVNPEVWCVFHESIQAQQKQGEPCLLGTVRVSPEQNSSAWPPKGVLDLLTRLPQETDLLVRLEQEIRKGIEEKTTCAYLTVAIDHMAHLFIQHSQKQMGSLIRLVAEVLSQTLREEDYLARLSGTSFGIILPGYDHKKMKAASEHLVHKVQSLKIRFSENTDVAEIVDTPSGDDDKGLLRISLSTGSMVFPRPNLTPRKILRHAERTLFEA